MLRSFRVENHKSIRAEQELLLVPVFDKRRPVVPVAAIFGANASGKSNVVDALRFMSAAVRGSYGRWEAGTGVPRSPFRLAPTALGEPSTYAVALVIDGVRHEYGFIADNDRVVGEWLHHYPHNKKAVIFDREGPRVALGSTIPERQSRTRLLEGVTRDNSLLLSAAVQANQAEVMPVYRWFQTSLRILRERGPHVDLERLESSLAQHPELVDLIRVADFGITDVRVESTAVPLSVQDEAEAADIELRLERLSRDHRDGQRVAEQLAHLETRISRLRQGRIRKQLVFSHGSEGTLMGVRDQSDGTLAWIRLLSVVLDVLALGGVVVVDELDASLHPRLCARVVELFRSSTTNPHNAQLLFTTHDATMLGTSFGREILARDEVWFVEKDATGATSLFPLTDFHPRKDENTERRYLGGSYGAVPAVYSDTFVERLTELRGESARGAG